MGFAAEIIHFSVKISKKCSVNQNPRMNVFEEYAERYDMWYEKNEEIFKRELSIIPPPTHPSIEIGVGTGRFASILGIDVGVDISNSMLRIAKNRGIECIRSDAEYLPFKDHVFKSAYLIFTLCFLENLIKSLCEVKRVLKNDGFLILCIIPKDSGLGREYSSKNSPFYRIAKFYTEKEVKEMLSQSKFEVMEIYKIKLRYSGNDFICFKCK